jgi:hypothetical protein
VAWSVEARTFVVDTTTDDAGLGACDDAAPEDCSLRGAVLGANGRPASEASTVYVPAGTYVLSQMSSCTHTVDPINPNLIDTIQVPLCIVKNVTLQGDDAATTIIEGNQARVLLQSGRRAPPQRHDRSRIRRHQLSAIQTAEAS